IADGHHALILAEAAPEVNVGQDDIHTAHANTGRQLVPCYQAHICGEGNVARLTDLAHALQVPGGVFQILQVDSFGTKRTQHTQRSLHGPGGIRVPSNGGFGEMFAEETNGRELTLGRQDSALEFQDAKAVALDEFLRPREHRLRRVLTADFAVVALISVEKVCGHFDAVADLTSQKRADGPAERLAGGIEEGHLDPGANDRGNSGLVADAEDTEPVVQDSGFQRINSEHVGFRGFDRVLDCVAAVGLAYSYDALVS